MQSQTQYPSRFGTCGFYTHAGPKVEELKAEDFHVLSIAEKRSIFQKHIPLQAKARETGTAILQRLEEMVPAVADRFELKADPIDNLTMRLWCPRQETRDAEKSYICLSYRWNRERHSRPEGSELPLPISSLMFSALAAQRKSSNTGLWIDQLCIDQKNFVEKAMSVGAMDAVYRCAELVVVALQDIEVNLGHQAFLRSQLQDFGDDWWHDSDGCIKHSTDTPPYFETHPVLGRFLYTVLGSHYFTRAWCSHELQMRSNYVFCVPCQAPGRGGVQTEVFHFTSDFLLYMIVLSTRVPCGVREIHSTSNQEIVRIQDLREKLITALRIDPSNGRDRISGMLADSEGESDRLMQPYPAQIKEIFSLGAGGDPDLQPELQVSSAYLDKSTIVLNILGNGLGIKRKMNHVVGEDDCIRDLYMVGLAANDPLTLCTMGQHFNFSQSTENLSWLRHPSFVDLGCGSERQSPVPRMMPQLTQRIRLDQSSENRWVQLDVVALGTPRPPKESFRDMAERLIDKCITLDMGRHPPLFQGYGRDLAADYVGKTDFASRFMSYVIDGTTTWGPGPEYQYWYGQTFFGIRRKRFNWTVACILECGLVWILGTALRCGFPATPHVLQQFDAVFPEGIWNLAYFDSMSWALHESGRNAIGAIMSLANWAVEWGNDRPNGWDTDYMPVLFDHGSLGVGHAMIFTGGDAILQIVIPCQLLEDHYGRLYRVWFLEAKDDPLYHKMMYGGEVPEWFLRTKAIMFTDVDAKDIEVSEGSAGDGKPGWRFRAQVKIHGPPRFVNDEIKKHINMEDEVEAEKPVEAREGASVSHAAGSNVESSSIPAATAPRKFNYLALGFTSKKDRKSKNTKNAITGRDNNSTTEAQKVGEAAGPATTEDAQNELSWPRRAIGKTSSFLGIKKS